LAASIGLRTTVVLGSSQGNNITLDLKRLKRKFSWKITELERVVNLIEHDEKCLTPPPLNIERLQAIEQLLDDEEDHGVMNAVKVFLFYVISVLHDNTR